MPCQYQQSGRHDNPAPQCPSPPTPGATPGLSSRKDPQHSKLLHPAVAPSVPWRPASLVQTPQVTTHQLPIWNRTSRRSHFIMTQGSTDTKASHSRIALCTPGASTHSLKGRSSRSAIPAHCQFAGLDEYADTSALPQELPPPGPHTTARASPTHTPEPTQQAKTHTSPHATAAYSAVM